MLRPDPAASSDERLRIAAVGDLHVTAAAKGQWRETFAEASRFADVLCLCGDLTNRGTHAEAESLAQDLRAIAIPVVVVLGNHDHHSGQVDEIERVLCAAGVKLLEDESHIVKGVGFARVKGFGRGFEGRMLVSFGEPTIKAFVQEALDRAMRLEHALHELKTERTVVLLHYAPVTTTLCGEAESIYPFLRSSHLAETIDRFDEVCVILHGLAHHGHYLGQTRKGITVHSVAASVSKPGGKVHALVEV